MKCDSKYHVNHMCSMREQGRLDCIKEFSSQPTVECRHCGAKANSSKYVCAAHMIDMAPNVEGGHGNVGIDEIGKLHHTGPKKEI